jgi:ABC transport system ATP-binding/permease protein
MSEEILDALMQFFAIIAKQDDGMMESEEEYVRSFLVSQLNADKVEEFMAYFLSKAKSDKKEGEKKLTSVNDSVRVLGLCKKINKKLNANQKVVVLVRLFELVNTSRAFTEQRMAIINTVANVFNISKEEFTDIETFVIQNDTKKLDTENILIISDKKYACEHCKLIPTGEIDEDVIILHIKSSDLYFLKYIGIRQLSLNGMILSNKRIYLYAQGSTLKFPKGKPVYYSDVVSHFMADELKTRLSFNVNNLEYRFPSGGIGLRDINISEEQGKLVGIMGASGAGKTTLMNVLSGINSPSAGEVLINGVNLHTEKEYLDGVIGYIPQDDLLIEELTVFENLYYCAKLCFKDYSKDVLTELVHKTLKSLGLFDRKHLTVGSPMNKMISGGQRKRLNIALELIREPAILFVDEPTSGLSSRDSENVMDLLRELVLKGKLIYVVIHQPSSEIYKMFDKMVILDTCGYLVYYGNPVEAVEYFKKADNQINSDEGECPVCGNINPEMIFNIIEAQVVDEYGNYTDKRKVAPTEWENQYKQKNQNPKLLDCEEYPEGTLNVPNWFTQCKIYLTRDALSKISNTQYILMNLLEAPILGFILSYLIRYIADPNSNTYIFRDNENFPRYIFMSIVVALFLGLTVSAEEIFKDRKILKREKFLNLSRSSYLISKILIMIVIGAIQAFLFTLIGNTLLSVPGMFFEYWLTLFLVFVLSAMIGLNISQTFNSAVTIYILIPFILIPMMALGGAMFTFDKLNRSIGSVGKTPVIADMMPSKWAYEALMVNQFKNNKLSKEFFTIEQEESNADFKKVYYIPTLRERLQNITDNFDVKDKKADVESDIKLLFNEFSIQNRETKIDFPFLNKLTYEKFDDQVAGACYKYLDKLDTAYSQQFDEAYKTKERYIAYYTHPTEKRYNDLKNKYLNESLKEIVCNVYEKNKVLVYDSRIIQQIDPIYQEPDQSSYIGIRSHFYAPHKMFMGKRFGTFGFNIMVILVMTILLYIPLYFEWTIKMLDFFAWLGVVLGKLYVRFKPKKRAPKVAVKPLLAQPVTEEKID